MLSDDGVSVFESVRPRLFGIAYRMLGSAAEAEDIVQDAWLRWQGTDRNAVQDPPAFLATTTTRLAMTFAQSARSRHETYIGPWLPEPVDTSVDPRLGAERAEALEFAVLLLLEKLSPTERAAYILREAFDYSYDQIAHTIRSTETNARQLVTRARKHISDGRRKSVSSREQRRLLNAFVLASKKGDLPALEKLFASDVVSYADGGGAVHVARLPVSGRERVVNYFASVGPFMGGGVTIEWIETNGQADARAAERGSHCSGDYRSVERRNLQSLTSDETQQARRNLAISCRKTWVSIRGTKSRSLSSCSTLATHGNRQQGNALISGLAVNADLLALLSKDFFLASEDCAAGRFVTDHFQTPDQSEISTENQLIKS